VPLPLHERVDVSVEPVQVAAAHCVPEAYTRQPPAPLHEPSVPQVDAPWSVHWFSGSVPVGTLVHVPSVPASAHDWHVPAQAVPQQIPCVQNPVRHSVPEAQAMPVGFLVQTPATHTLGAVQSPSTVHDVLHSIAAHA
jgi:hypothetical protein